MVSSRSQRSADNDGRSREIIRRGRKLPIAFYSLKDSAARLTARTSFMDAVLGATALLVIATALPFYPLPVLVLLLVLLVAITLYHPFLGLIALMALIFPAFMYQLPAIALFFLFIVSASLIIGYMHYRSLTFLYILVALAFSPLGFLLEIPALIIATLIIGYKRAVLVTIAALLSIVALSALTGVQNSGYIYYNATLAHQAIVGNTVAIYHSVSRPALSVFNFASGFSSAMSQFGNSTVTGSLTSTVSSIAASFTVSAWGYLAMLGALVVMVLMVDFVAATWRSRFRGMVASMPGLIYPFAYMAMVKVGGGSPSLLALASFVIAPAFIYGLALYGINIVKVLDVRKQDLRMKFGEAFEDLVAAGGASETFADIGDYEATKKELRDAVLAPIEERGISKAYNVKPAKGILLFGPPGTGKTLMMRALANEIHAGFYHIKASNLISPYPGETEKKLSDIFSIAKKNAPCVLFIDEIDSIAGKRYETQQDESRVRVATQLMIEMDGFQKVGNVIIVGATNAPNLLDPALLRPGRLDKIIYMPLPDIEGRKSIFRMYLGKLPIAKDVDYTKLAERTERYSGADIKAVCESVAQIVAQKAAGEHKVLAITMQEILDAVNNTKPSTTMSQIESYNAFRLDFERRSFEETRQERAAGLTLDDVVGLDEAKRAVREAVEMPLLHPELTSKYGVKAINGMLLFGPPGTGKTMLMRAVVNEMHGVTMLDINGAALARMSSDKATSTIKEIFDRAKENAPSVIMIDEIDGIFPSRQGASEAAVQRVSLLLQEIDGISKVSDVVIVGATNNPDGLDPAVLRPGRFDKLIFVKPPNASQRIELFRHYLKDAPVEKGIDFQRLANVTRGYTGADIANVCREAKTLAMEESIRSGQETQIAMLDLDKIISKFRPSAPEQAVNRYAEFLARYGER